MNEFFNLVAVNPKTGHRTYLTGYPMSRAECLTMRGKNSDRSRALIELEPAAAPADFAAFLAAYRAALAWSTSGEHNGQELDGLECFDFAPAALRKTADDCAAFIAANLADCRAAAAVYGWDGAGHDLWLTRAGHGAGYWDGDLPAALGERLTEAAKAVGEQWPEIGDDGLIYV